MVATGPRRGDGVLRQPLVEADRLEARLDREALAVTPRGMTIEDEILLGPDVRLSAPAVVEKIAFGLTHEAEAYESIIAKLATKVEALEARQKEKRS